MNKLLQEAIEKRPITDNAIADALYEICDRVHATCYSDCPVYEKFYKEHKRSNFNCPYHKNGMGMLKYLRGEL
jgi:hypothetical protein